MSPQDKQVTGALAEFIVDMSATDGLTGAMSLGALVDRGRGDVTRSRRYGALLSCIIVDIDNFKVLNADHGKAAGDLVLQRVAAICSRVLRAGAYVGRIGDDEFAIILPEMSLLHAAGVAERLRRNLSAEQIASGGQYLRVTASIGVAERSRWTTRIEGVLEAAECAMHDARVDGGDRIACFFENDLRVSTSSVQIAV
jgi:diguanylate cyclase (GGDEF)-like protein